MWGVDEKGERRARENTIERVGVARCLFASRRADIQLFAGEALDMRWSVIGRLQKEIEPSH